MGTFLKNHAHDFQNSCRPFFKMFGMILERVLHPIFGQCKEIFKNEQLGLSTTKQC